MFLVQAGLLLLIWLGSGVLMWRRSDAIRSWAQGMPRRRKGLLGALMLLAGAFLLIGSLLLVQMAGGSDRDGFRWWAVLAIGLAGTLFVTLQVLAAAVMITLVQESVTSQPQAPSTKVESDS